MKEEKVGKLLNELARATAEPVRPGFAEDIKNQIPPRLTPHRTGLDTVSIIIDLRINKLTAAAAIIITLILCASLLDGRDPAGSGIYQDSKMLVKHLLSGKGLGRSETSLAKSRYEYLLEKGKEAAYYGDNVYPADSNAVLMQWRLSDGKYRVIFGDLRERTVTAEELVKLQARMLEKKTR
ncbi:MAG: hypothetical protein ACYSSO_08180 [Planctomycetota bacterium]|jgi:hypothetical protein